MKPDAGLRGHGSCYIVGSVISKDGTQIGYRRYGEGPALVLVQGAIGTTQSFHELARCLEADFTVYVPERRGRPMSPQGYGPEQGIQRELDDLQSVLQRSGASRVFGLSSGAVIALEAARVLPSIDRLVLFEPPLYVSPRRMRFDLVSRYHREVAAGHTAAAMLSALQASGLAPPLLRYLPRPAIVTALRLYLRIKARTPGTYPPLRDLVASMRFDFDVVSGMQDRLETFRSVASSVLLLSAVKSPAYLQEASIELARLLPDARRIELPDMDHGGPWNADQGGKPSAVADAMRDFLLA